MEIKEIYGDRLVLHGGTNAALWHDRDATVAEIESLVPQLMADGGYIFASDHSIPSSVSLETFRAIVETCKRIGKY
jgi:uroporphyrinogen decarboxylase